MKRQLQIILGATAVTAFAFPAPAQDTTKPKPARPDYSQHETAQERRADRLNGAAKASDLIGITVKNYQNEKLGTVEDLAVDVESGRVVQVILSTGGFLGMGDVLTAVPPGALHHDTTNKVLHLDANKDRLKSSPRFEMTKWADSSSSNHLAATYRQFGEEPAFNFIGQGEPRRDGQRNQTDQRQNYQPNQQRNQTDRSPTDRNEANERNAVTGNNDQAWDTSRAGSTRHAMIPSERLGQVQRASKLIGMTVKNRQDETLGDVDNLLVDLASGRVVAIVVSSGGFLGLGDELSAVPPTALGFNAMRDTLLLDVSKEALAQAPHFSSDKWPDFSQASYSSGVYRAYQVEPYFGTDHTRDAGNFRDVRTHDDRTLGTTAPDNSERNERDRNSQTLTPVDQGNSQADVATTTRIRKEIMSGRLSVNAQNVKVITKNGQVTLRGPVNSPEEKRIIGDIANRVAQAANVKNQLEVKVTNTSTN